MNYLKYSLIIFLSVFLSIGSKHCFADKYGIDEINEERNLEEFEDDCYKEPDCIRISNMYDANEKKKKYESELKDRELKNDPVGYYLLMLWRIILLIAMFAGVLGMSLFFIWLFGKGR